MNPWEYKREHPHCELIRHFPRKWGGFHVPGHNSVTFPLFGGRCLVDAHELHHIVGKTSKGRTNDPRNVLNLCHTVHEWVTDHACAGRILCCWELKSKGILDWAFLSGLDGKNWPGLFETDLYLADVERFPWMREYHQTLIRRAA